MESRGTGMRGILRPDFQYEMLQDIQAEDLQANGIKGLILDLDNTITPWNDRTLTEDVIAWFKKMNDAGIKACIVSNNRGPERVSAVADVLEILYVYRAKKPQKKAFLRGIRVLDIPESEVAVIGDQLFTDVFGGNKFGLKTILVSPIAQKEFPGTKVLRFMERLVGRKAKYTRR
ncbi:MAG: YqeG family HAD IIIA-type phosphatase [Dehalobacter sp. 4CP]|uniref:YqeG family HAD IIIA-type phosphatase n=1 Tax=Dehalobacter sp. CP TaxID=2594474 RepID=UPI0013CACADD|nr:YqeG family HAD IIIA-type phosphatase [Dehalobacter sp. 4CP]